MSDEELVKQARQALEGTTPGPWYFDNNEGYGANNIWSPHPEDNARADLVAASVGDSAEAEANASFIAAAPTLVAAMADRIEALTADRVKNNKDYCALMERYDALTEQLEAACADAKEAEAYAEELEKERDHWQDVAGRQGVCMTCHGPRGAPEPYGCSDCLNTGYCGEWHNEMQELREKLAKAVEALRFYADENRYGLPSDGPWGLGSTDFGKIARATLAEIEGSNAA